MATTAQNTKTNDPVLPTHSLLGTKPPATIAALPIAESWITDFSSAVESTSIDALCNLIYRDGCWRDMLSLTWNMRSFYTHSKIRTFLTDRLALSGMKNIQLDRSEKHKEPILKEVYDDLSWIPVFFTFETRTGKGSGIAHLVLLKDGAQEKWVAYSVYTNLEEIHGHPERTFFERPENSFQYSPEASGGGRPALTWEELRTRESEFIDSEPVVVCIGGGQSGLGVAARLKCLGIPTLVLEKRARIGDNWRGRYDSLALHDPVWYDHMPYIPFPANWPIFTPAQKLADWLESYSKSMELNVWTGVDVESCVRDDNTGLWNVTVFRSDGTKRVLKPRHIVHTPGIAGGEVNMPKYPGMENFPGKVLHSTSHGSARDYAGKKVVVVGAATSGHDVAYDCYNQGVDVTMIQRSPVYVMDARRGFGVMFRGTYEENGPSVDTADRIFSSFPIPVRKSLAVREVAEIKQSDQPLLDKLEKAGMMLYDGVDGSGVLYLAYTRGGGYYLDVGASQLVADGKIKLKSGYDIECFTERGIKLKDGAEVPADVVVFATGFGDPRPPLYKLFGEPFINSMRYRGGLNSEGEMRLYESHNEQKKNFWVFGGNLALCRFHSKLLTLQIQAVELGLDLSLYYEAPV